MQAKRLSSARGRIVEDILILSPSARIVRDCAAKLAAFREGNDGYSYLAYRPQTPPDRLLPEDLAVTLAFNSRAGGRAFQSLVAHCEDVDLVAIPDKPLAEATPGEMEAVVDVIDQMTSWDGFRISLATKTLHKKRPNLIPVLDNQAIFEAYMEPRWPERHTKADSWWGKQLIRTALQAVFADLHRSENQESWRILAALDPALTQIETLDMVWWKYFRELEPVAGPR